MQVPSHSLERTITVSFAHRIFFTRSVFSPANPLLAQMMHSHAKALVVIDEGVTRVFPKLSDEISRHFAVESCPAQLVATPLIAAGGEAVKNNHDLVDQLYHEIPTFDPLTVSPAIRASSRLLAQRPSADQVC